MTVLCEWPDQEPRYYKKRGEMTDASKILDKILPEKHLLKQNIIAGGVICDKCRWIGYIDCSHNKDRESLRQRLLSTYGKEWVGVPSENEIKQIIVKTREEFDGYKELSHYLMDKIAESILKGLRGK